MYNVNQKCKKSLITISDKGFIDCLLLLIQASFPFLIMPIGSI